MPRAQAPDIRAGWSPPPTSLEPREEGALLPEPETATWRWRHLWLFGLCAWGLPQLVNPLIAPELSGADFLGAALVVQIFGYLLAAAVLYILVKRVQGGLWGSVGLRLSDLSLEELARGAGFGLALSAIWLPLSFLLERGELKFDRLVSTLIGDTSGAGLLLAGVVVVVGAPFIEEIYYRGMLYAKLARRGYWLAILGTSLLFVMAHGALLIPALLFLAFGLGWKRRGKSLWYTIGAHGAWNFVVICLAAYVLLGPAKSFSPADSAYDLEYPARWQRITDLEQSSPGAAVDLALEAPGGSFMGVARFDLPPGTPDSVMSDLLNHIQEGPSEAKFTPGKPARSGIFFEGATLTYEASASFVVEDETCAQNNGLSFCQKPSEVTIHSRYVAALLADAPRAIVFNMACPEPQCDGASTEFERLLSSVALKT